MSSCGSSPRACRARPSASPSPSGPVGAIARTASARLLRLALARAFLADPALLILDEPTAHLDPSAGQGLTADLLHATVGRSVLLIVGAVRRGRQRQPQGADQAQPAD